MALQGERASNVFVTCIRLLIALSLTVCWGSLGACGTQSISQEAEAKGDVATVPGSPSDLKGEHVEDVCYSFAKAGFTEIEPREDADLRIGVMHKEGDVSKVTIDGDSSFYEDDEYPTDARVVVEYHTYRDKDERSISKDELVESIEEWVAQAQPEKEEDGDVEEASELATPSSGHDEPTSEPSTSDDAIVIKAGVPGEYGRTITTYGGGSEYDYDEDLVWFVPEGAYTVKNLDTSLASECVWYGVPGVHVNDDGFQESDQLPHVDLGVGETADIEIPAGGVVYIAGPSGKLELTKR